MKTKPKTWRGLYTKAQMIAILAASGVAEKLPTKGKILYVAFPPKFVRRLGTVTFSPLKSTYGKRLYSYVLR